jgi:hypothetical protein
VSSVDILIAFPDANVTAKGGTFSWSAIAHYVVGGGGPSPLIADGQEHVLEALTETRDTSVHPKEN